MMSDRWQIKDLQSGMELEATFYPNPQPESGYRFRATVRVRAPSAGQAIMDFVKTEVLMALEEAIGGPQRLYFVFLAEFNRGQENARTALMPALDATRRVSNPIENNFLPIPDNVQ